MFWFVRVAEGGKCPVLLLFKCGGVVLGSGDYMFGGRIHYVLVVLMFRVFRLWYVFGSVKRLSDFYWELWVVGDPCGYGGQVV